jgi:tRNA dimethylallyltransferase
LRKRLLGTRKKHGAEHLHKILARLDRESAARIAPRDAQKIIRAIEMRLLTGKPVAEIFRAASREKASVETDAALRENVGVSEYEVHEEVREQVGARAGVRANPLEGYAVTKIGLSPPRPVLYARIDARVHEMLAAGWLDEVRRLVSSGVPENVKPFQFIGYSDLRAHLEGHISLADAILQIQQSTRRFAKRQLTWFRREQNVHWFESFGDAEETTRAALNFLS